MFKADQIDSNQRQFWLISIILVSAIIGMALIKASSFLVIAILAAFVIALFSFLAPEYALYLLLAAMLLSPEFMVKDLPGLIGIQRSLTLRYEDLLLLIIGTAWFMKTAINKELGLFVRTPLNKTIAAYLTICFISTIMGVQAGRVKGITGFLFVMKYFEYVVIYFMAVNILKEKKQIERFVAVMLIVCLVTCIVGLVQVPSGGRVSAPFEGEVGEPNTLGGYLILMMAVVIGLLLGDDRRKLKPFLLFLFIVIVVTLAMTLSRGSWLALFPMLFTLIYLTNKRFALVFPLLFIIAFSPVLLPQSVKDRFYYTFMQPSTPGQVEIGGFKLDTSTSDRILSWKQVLTQDFVKHPVFGYGVTGYPFLDAQYPRVLAETGLLGLFAFIILLIAVFRLALSIYRRAKDPFFKGLTLGYLGGFVGLLIHSIGCNTFIIVRIMEPFWFLTAMVVMIPQIEQGLAGKQGDQKE
ncbi:MAG: O-antigen ligase family protein [Deltaproteobacteria bacterium]|nr:O-antigen ligase family protein [Deltaproteobacteria bacterium]